MKLGKYVSGFAILILLLFSFAVPAITHINSGLGQKEKPTVEISENFIRRT